MFDSSKTPILLISGPSGIGKTFLADKLEETGKCERILMTTTRTRRPSEVPGLDYEFLSLGEYEQALNSGDFFMDNSFFGNLYGIRTAAVNKIIQKGKNPIGIIYTPLITQFLERYTDSYCIYLYPYNRDLWLNNLIKRDGDLRRLVHAEEELSLFQNNYRQYYDKIFPITHLDYSYIIKEVLKGLESYREEKESRISIK